MRAVAVIISGITFTVIVNLLVFCSLRAVPDHVSEGTLNLFLLPLPFAK